MYKLSWPLYLHLSSKLLLAIYIRLLFHLNTQICLKLSTVVKAWISEHFLTVYSNLLANEHFHKLRQNFCQKNQFHIKLQSIVANLINMLSHKKLKMVSSILFYLHSCLQFDLHRIIFLQLLSNQVLLLLNRIKLIADNFARHPIR